MPLPVINDVYRITLLWEGVGGVTPRNSLHFRTDLTDPDDIGLAFDTGWYNVRGTAEPLYAMSSFFECPQIEILPLDGSSAGTLYTLPHQIQGNQSGEWAPQVCAVVSLKTTQRGARGRGRMYVGPCTESSVQNGTIVDTVQTEMQDAWDLVVAEFDQTALGLQLVVASYTHADSHDVTSARVDHVAGTQRRRQDQLR